MLELMNLMPNVKSVQERCQNYCFRKNGIKIIILVRMILIYHLSKNDLQLSFWFQNVILTRILLQFVAADYNKLIQCHCYYYKFNDFKCYFQ